LGGPKNSSLYQCPDQPLGPVYYPMGTRGSLPGGKAAGTVKLITYLHLCQGQQCTVTHPLPQYAFTAWCSVTEKGQHYLYGGGGGGGSSSSTIIIAIMI